MKTEFPEDWKEKNNRRGDLIFKKYTGGGLTEDEKVELETLQQMLFEIQGPLIRADIERLMELPEVQRAMKEIENRKEMTSIPKSETQL